MGKFRLTYEKDGILYSQIIECKFNDTVGLKDYLKSRGIGYADSIKSIEQLEPIVNVE